MGIMTAERKTLATAKPIRFTRYQVPVHMQVPGIDARVYNPNDKLVMGNLSNLIKFLASTDHSYEAKTTITTMQDIELGRQSISKDIYDMEIAEIESNADSLTNSELVDQKRAAKAQHRARCKQAKTNWKQCEWAGFHFENIVANCTLAGLGGEGKRYGRTVLDTMIGVGDNAVPLDVKFHAMFDKHGRKNVSVILNAKDAVEQCIEEYGVYYLMIAKSEAEFDHDGSTKEFHNKLKNRITSINANSRIMKSKVDILEFSIYAITKENFHMLSDFNQGQQQSGRSRKPKFLMNFDKGGFIPVAKFVTDFGIAKGR